MQGTTHRWLLIAAINGFLSVALGAFAAHGLQGRVSPADLAAFQTGAHYHMTHALALLAIAWLSAQQPKQRLIHAAGWGFLLGIGLFCGSLYILGFSGSRALVWLTPLGGLAFLSGWAALAGAALQWPREAP